MTLAAVFSPPAVRDGVRRRGSCQRRPGNSPECEITRQSGSLGTPAVPAADQGPGRGQQLGRARQAAAAHGQGRPGRYGDARDHRRVPFAGDGRSCQPVPGRAQPAGWPGCLLWSGGLCPSCSGGGNHGRRCLCCAGRDCLHLVHVLGLQGKRPSQRNQEGCEPLSHTSATRLTATSDRLVPEPARTDGFTAVTRTDTADRVTWAKAASSLVRAALIPRISHKVTARAGDHQIRRSVPLVRPVRRNPYRQVSVLPGVRHRSHSPVPSGQSVRKL